MSPPTEHPRSWILYVALGIFALSQIFGAWSDWRSAEARSKGDEISRCLTGYRLTYVDGPEADALADLADFGVDSAEFETATDVFRTGNAKLEDLNRKARLDADGFLRDCRADNP